MHKSFRCWLLKTWAWLHYIGVQTLMTVVKDGVGTDGVFLPLTVY